MSSEEHRAKRVKCNNGKQIILTATQEKEAIQQYLEKLENMDVPEPYVTPTRSMSVEDAQNLSVFTPNRKRKMQPRSESRARSPNPSIFTPKHQGKASSVHPSTEEKVSAACRLDRRYSQITEEARYARSRRDQAKRNVRTAKDGLIYLECQKSDLMRNLKEGQERRRAIEMDIKLLEDQILATDDELKDQAIEMEEAEAHFRKMESDHAAKHQRSKLIEFLKGRSERKDYTGSQFQGCTKDDLRFLYEITSSNAVIKLSNNKMIDIFRDLRMGGYEDINHRMGGYEDIKHEWNERMRWTHDDWVSKGGLSENINIKREKRKWMENVFLEIFGYKNVENSNN